MTSHRTLFPQPDDRQALAQLEQLHREIQNARRQRERAGAEFDGFVASFADPRTDTTGPRGAVPSRRPRPSAISRPVAPAPSPREATPPPRSFAEPPPVLVAPIASQPASAVPSVDVTPAAPRARPRRGVALAVAGIAILALAIATDVWRNNPPPSSANTQTPVRTPPPVVVLPHEETDSALPTPPAASPLPLEVEITVVRPVWLRATVDGHRAVERQVPAGTRLTFTPSDSITVRAGDAGAVRVKIGAGPEEPLGPDGQVLTRAFVVSR